MQIVEPPTVHGSKSIEIMSSSGTTTARGLDKRNVLPRCGPRRGHNAHNEKSEAGRLACGLRWVGRVEPYRLWGAATAWSGRSQLRKFGTLFFAKKCPFYAGSLK
jgi:hypothetical protein